MTDKTVVSGSMRVNAFAVLADAVSRGIEHGWRRAYKHADKPSEADIREAVEIAVIDAICEYFVFDGDDA